MSTANNNQKKSINLYVQFFDFVKQEKNKEDFDNLLRDVKNDKILMSSDLKKFLDSICKDSKIFDNSYKEKIKSVRKTSKLTLKELKEQLRLK